MMSRGLYPITEESNDLPYFPEKLIVQWLKETSNETVDMYAFSNQLGVAPLREAYMEIIKKHNVDTLIMVDGGTDSLMFGDESGVGTIIEDSCSLVATLDLPVEKSFLVATAFGVEQHHNLNHYSCLENIATLTKADAANCFGKCILDPWDANMLKIKASLLYRNGYETLANMVIIPEN